MRDLGLDSARPELSFPSGNGLEACIRDLLEFFAIPLSCLSCLIVGERRVICDGVSDEVESSGEGEVFRCETLDDSIECPERVCGSRLFKGSG
jgi:hypothetical protein